VQALRRNLEVVHAINERSPEAGLVHMVAMEKLDQQIGIISYQDLVTFGQDRHGNDLRYSIDASKIHQKLGWFPKETFETGLRKTVEWYLNHLDWCRHVQDGSYQRQRLGLSTPDINPA